MEWLARFNSMSDDAASAELHRCCHSQRWVEGVMGRRPFESAEKLYEAASVVWTALGEVDWREAFAGHPRIGDRDGLKSAPLATRAWAHAEQGGALADSEDIIAKLAGMNQQYEIKFGHIFLICASGKSGGDMIGEIQKRMNHSADTELRAAADEQAKITRLRLERLVKS